MPRLFRAQGLLAVGLGLAAAACSDTAPQSDLLTEGPPRVITVTVYSESSGEISTYCAPESDGERLNELYCPSAGTVTDALPLGWSLRIVFNELLIADRVEELTEDGSGTIINTQPVTLQCAGADVPYDGYYQPSGNHLTDPPGPALVVWPLAYVPTGAACEVTVKPDVAQDKDFQDVTKAGPYDFEIAPLAIYGSDPEDGATGVDPTAPLVVEFNGLLDPDSLAGAVSLAMADGTPVPIAADASDNFAVIYADTPSGALDALTDYTLTIDSGVADIGGGVLALPEPFVVHFTTGELPMP